MSSPNEPRIPAPLGQGVVNDSLYQLVLSRPLSIEPLQVSLSTLKSIMGAMIDLLIEQQISAKLWIKLPQQAEWLTEIERYSQQPYCEAVYQITAENGSNSGKSNANWHQIFLDSESPMQQEFWLAIASPQFWGAIVAHQPQATTLVSGEKTRHPPLLTLLSFELPVVEQVLTQLSQLGTLEPFSQILPTQGELYPSPQLLQKLLPKLIQQSETPEESVVVEPGFLQAEDRLLASDTLLQELRSKDLFLNNIVQELRMPLTNMIAALSLLNSPKIRPEQRQRYLSLLNNECDRQRSLIDSLLDLLELERTQEHVQLRCVRLSEVIPGVVSTYQPIAREKGITLGYTVPENLPPVSGLENWLRQISVKLLHNAIKFTPPGGQVKAIAKQQGDFVEIEFHDTGIGIPKAEIPKIFERFYRVRSTNGESSNRLSRASETASPVEGHPEGGAGLGLTIVRQLLLCCGGSISVTSQVGKGSVFKVLLPIYRQGEPSSKLC